MLTRSTRIAIAAVLGVTAAAVALPTGAAKLRNAARTLEGREVQVGNGTARMYVELASTGAPIAVGIALTEKALTGLATHMNTTSRCFDKNGDGAIAHGECLGDYQATLAMPGGASEISSNFGLPIRWATVNWNPEGHLPPAPHVWSAAHFDFHFFLADPALIEGIRTGPCAEFIHCEDSARATMPLPAHHAPEGYIDVGAAVPSMGNHLVDSRDPELADPSLGFSHTFIYGTYDAKVIFLEPMVSLAFLSSRPQECRPVRAPKAYATTGYYPTLYCVRYDAASTTYRVSLEGLVYRQGA